jgi:hypothetical protein
MTFGFRVKREMEWDEETYQHTDVPTGNWTVELPHQCDAWQIAGKGYSEGLEHREAVAELAAFIVEAQRAMAALVNENEFGEDE